MGTLLPCPNYNTIIYVLQIFVPLLITISMISAFIPYINKLAWYCFKQLCNRQLWDKQWVQDKIDAVVERVFDRILKKHSSQEEGNVYIVLNYKAPHSYTNLLYFTFVCLIVSALAQFWDNMIEESYECTTKRFLCCYYYYYYDPQSLNCSNTSHLRDYDITSVTCYRFVFKLGTATASALGIVGTIGLTIFAITWCILKTTKGSRATTTRLTAFLIQSTTALIVLTATVLLSIYKVNLYPIFSLKSQYELSEICPIGILISVYIFFFPWRQFKKNDTDAYTNINP